MVYGELVCYFVGGIGGFQSTKFSTPLFKHIFEGFPKQHYLLFIMHFKPTEGCGSVIGWLWP